MGPRELTASLASLWRWVGGLGPCAAGASGGGEQAPRAGEWDRPTEAAAPAGAADERQGAMDDFLATLAHELRTPVTAALGWTWVVRHRDLDVPELRHATETIEANIRALLRIADDLLDVARIARGDLRVEMAMVGLTGVVERVLEGLRPTIEARGLALDVALDARPDLVLGDATRLQQVVWNLVMNAMKFTPAGGRIAVRLERGEEGLAVSVRDTGVGIAPALLPHVFERFRQGGSVLQRRAGLGLGLAIVRHLVELHGGTVRAESAGEGQGATFTVVLPPVPAEAMSEPVASERAGEEPMFGRVLAGVRVLVVDDDAGAREIAGVLLRSAGALVREAGSAGEAVDNVRRWRPQVLVVDLAMPGEDGFALLRAVRALPVAEGGATPAVALTAYVRRRDREQALAAGFTDYLAKPFDPPELVRVVAACARPAGRAGRVSAVRRRAVLLAEDDPAAREVGRTVLEEQGYRVFEAASGAEALHVWASHHEEIGVVVTDIMMPQGTGAHLYRALSREPSPVPVIVLSGYPLVVETLDAREQGVVEFLQKPIDPERLAASVGRALEDSS